MGQQSSLQEIFEQVKQYVQSFTDKINQAKDLNTAAQIYNKALKTLNGFFRLIAGLSDAAEKKQLGTYLNEQKHRLQEIYEKVCAGLENQLYKKLDAQKRFDFVLPFAPTVASAAKHHSKLDRLLASSKGGIHVITAEIKRISQIFKNLGFDVYFGQQLDTDYHVFEVLNIPEGHPAREMWDTFYTQEGLVPTTHTSNMQVRILKEHKDKLPIAAVVFGKVFRNEALDATHTHTFHQLEGLFVDKNIGMQHLLGFWEEFIKAYYGGSIEYRVMPAHFPFVEPGIEIAIKWQVGDQVKWLEILGAGVIHRKVLEHGDIDYNTYSGFAFGLGIERLIMLKLEVIKDIRDFYSGNLTLYKL